jgi:hypothetical protein
MAQVRKLFFQPVSTRPSFNICRTRYTRLAAYCLSRGVRCMWMDSAALATKLVPAELP